MHLIYIALGSAIGGVARYLIGKIITFNFSGIFPWGTFAVNVIGCFIIGLVYGYIDHGGFLSENARLFLTVGFCGGFTTFSTFTHENYLLFQSGNFLILASYAAISIFVGFIMTLAGYALIKN